MVELAISITALLVVYLASAAYRRSPSIYGAPGLPRPEQERLHSYRQQAAKELDAYHIAYLSYPAGHPGAVAFVPLIVEGVIELVDKPITEEDRELFGPRRAIQGTEKRDLDRHQQAAVELAQGVELLPLERALSARMADELAAELRGTRMQCPEGGRGLPQMATRSLWLMTLGACALLIGVGGIWGWLSVFVVTMACRAIQERGFAPGISLSEAGWWVTRQLEWDLYQRFNRTDRKAYSMADVALFFAVHPLPYGGTPKTDRDGMHVLRLKSSPQLDTSLGPRLSVDELDAARRTNQRRKLLVLSLGVVALCAGIGTSLVVGFTGATWIYVANAVLCGATLLFARWRLNDRADYDYIRDSKAFLPKGAK